MNTRSPVSRSASTHPGLNPLIVDNLLEKLSTDDDFRTLFHSSPANALASLGVAEAQTLIDQTLQPGMFFYCFITAELASKEEIASARMQLRKHLTAAGNQTVIFCFEANKILATIDCNDSPYQPPSFSTRAKAA